MVNEFALADCGLIDVKTAAERRGWSVKSVQNWINAGLLPVGIAGGGMRTVFLLRIADVDTFVPPARGRPAGTKRESSQRKANRHSAKSREK